MSTIDFSPDGKRIAYDSYRGIIVADADGRNARLFEGQPPVGDYLNADPSWSPDSRRVVFEHGDALYTISAADDDVQALTTGSMADWSPKGDRIVLVRDWDRDHSAGKIVAASVDQGDTRVLARGIAPAISPDGWEVAYSSAVGAVGASIFTVPIEGGKPRLVARNAFGPVWSPDGRYLAFARFTQCGHAVCSGRIFVMPVEGGKAKPLGPLVGDISPPVSWIE